MYFEETYYKDLKESVFSAVHKSGLKVFVMPKAGFTKSYAVLATRYGSVNNNFTAPGDKEATKIPDGIAHYLEHKMFDQEDGSSVFDKFALHGANANAFTGFTMTAYLFSAAADFYENLEILLDYTMHPYYTDETVEKEQGIIGQEIRMYEDDPGWNVYFNALRAMYQVNPVNIDIAGTVESIAEITKEKLYKCYNTFYHPSNMALFVTGNVNADSVGEIVERMITADSDPGEIINHFEKEPEKVAKQKTEAEFDIGTPQFVIAYKLSRLPEPGADYVKTDAVMSVLCRALFGKNSDIYNELYDENLINDSFFAGYEGELTYAFAEISGESKNPDEVFERIKKAVEKAKKTGISPEAVESAKRAVVGRCVSLIDRQESFSNEFVRFALKGADLLSYPATASSVTADEVNEALALLKEDMAVLSAVYPKGTRK